MNEVRYRVELNSEELKQLESLIKEKLSRTTLPSESLRNALKSLEAAKPMVATAKQLEAAKKATEARKIKTRRKIEAAVNQLRLENRPITMYAVAKVGRVSPNTVRKYRDFIEAAETERRRSQPVESPNRLL
jgi:beta-phosphoglucomutase-like phosphatase (HAD superfamily)